MLMNQIATEKEFKLRHGMRMMGLRDSAFFLSWILTYVLKMSLSVLIFVLVGMAFQFGALSLLKSIFITRLFHKH